jgi:hypothetical protein
MKAPQYAAFAAWCPPPSLLISGFVKNGCASNMMPMIRRNTMPTTLRAAQHCEHAGNEHMIHCSDHTQQLPIQCSSAWMKRLANGLDACSCVMPEAASSLHQAALTGDLVALQAAIEAAFQADSK